MAQLEQVVLWGIFISLVLTIGVQSLLISRIKWTAARPYIIFDRFVEEQYLPLFNPPDVLNAVQMAKWVRADFQSAPGITLLFCIAAVMTTRRPEGHLRDYYGDIVQFFYKERLLERYRTSPDTEKFLRIEMMEVIRTHWATDPGPNLPIPK